MSSSGIVSKLGELEGLCGQPQSNNSIKTQALPLINNSDKEKGVYRSVSQLEMEDETEFEENDLGVLKS